MSNLPKFTPEGSYDPNENKEYCSKSLYEQLQEQKNIKLKKFEEETSFENAVKIYDEDDLAFMQEVRQSTLLKEKEKANEVKALVELAKKKEAARLNNPINIYEKLDEKLTAMRKSTEESDKMNLLKSMMKRKRAKDSCEIESKSLKLDLDENEIAIANQSIPQPASEQIEPAGVPGMDAYASDDHSDSDCSSCCSSSSSDIDVGTLRPLIKRLNEKIKKNC